MIRINRNVAIFSGLIFFLGISSLTSLQKLYPLLSRTSYYCQSFINSLSIPIPNYLSAIPFIFFLVFLLIAAIKLYTIYIKVKFMRKRLIRSLKSDTRFNTLLKKLQLADKTHLIESEKQFAFCLGIRSPKIYVSTCLLTCLTTEELEAVLRHERYHLNNRDTLTMLIASIGESLLPFFPLLSDLLYNYRIEREVKADADAIQGLGDKKPLISVLRKFLVAPSVATISVSAIADHETLEPRIKVLVKKDFHFKKFKLKHVFISLASVFVISIIALAPIQAVEAHHKGEDVIIICPNNDGCIAACRQEYSENRKNYSSDNVLYTPIQ